EWYYLQRLSQLTLHTFAGHTTPVLSVAYSPDGRWLASAGGDHGRPGEIKVWDAATGQKARSLTAPAGRVWSVAFSPDGRQLAAGGESTGWEGAIAIWDTATGNPVQTIPGPLKSVRSLVFSPDGQRLVSAGGGFNESGIPLPGELKVWNVATGQLLL